MWGSVGVTPVEVVKAVVKAAEVMLEEDIAAKKVWGLVRGQSGKVGGTVVVRLNKDKRSSRQSWRRLDHVRGGQRSQQGVGVGVGAKAGKCVRHARAGCQGCGKGGSSDAGHYSLQPVPKVGVVVGETVWKGGLGKCVSRRLERYAI